MTTEKLVTFLDWKTKIGELHFGVPQKWLYKLFEDIAVYEYTMDNSSEINEPDYEEKEKSYVKYRTESLYDQLQCKYFASDILSDAIEDNVVQYCN